MSAKSPKALEKYRAKRDFQQTQEPVGDAVRRSNGRLFVIQKHAARNLHYDFRLELDGTLKSWAVPKGPNLDPDSKRLAVEVEDHPLDYADFEGQIPAGQYGGGKVLVWDRGTWEAEGDAAQGYRKGHLSFELQGEKLRGRWSLVRMRGRGEGQWLLIKSRDEYASDEDILETAPDSVRSGRDLAAIGKPSNPAPSTSAPKATKSRSVAKTNSSARIRKARPPSSFKPQLATLDSAVPQGEEWLHEIKYDGYRVLVIRRAGELQLLSRSGLDWTQKLARLARACQRLKADNFILDGELVVQDDQGVSDFQALQMALRDQDDSGLVYFAFDLPFAGGQDLRALPLIERKSHLKDLLQSADPMLHYSDHIVGPGEDFYTQACAQGLEGIISKRSDARYESRRSRTWLKIKCSQRQELVIAGYTDPSGSRKGLGALLLGVYDQDDLRYAGRVGTGFNDRLLIDLAARLRRLEIKQSPFVQPPSGREAKDVHWCKPELVGEVAYTGWTRDGRLRHPVFQGLREDKPAKSVVREQPITDNARQTKASTNRTKTRSSDKTSSKRTTRPKASRPISNDLEVAGVRISHSDRVLFPSQGVTKGELAEYYAQVAEWILPYVADRPLSLVRCPRGREKQCFYQKHLTDALPAPVQGIVIKESNKRSTYILIKDLAGLITLVQFGTLELHPWPARSDRLDRPDLLVFDLDPGTGVTFKQVIAAARHLRDALAALELTCFLRTTGGKGLHVVVPLERHQHWEELRSFAETLARLVAHDAPDRYVATATKSKREGRIYIDYLRNARGATSIASYSSRARPGAPVAVPLRWEEVGRLQAADAYNIRTLPRRLARLHEDPWAEFESSRQRLPKLKV